MTKTLAGVGIGDTETPYVRAAEGALRAAGMWEDEPWMLLGLSGLGFHLIADPGTCPSSPTAYPWTQVHTEAMQRIGVSSRCIQCNDSDGFEPARAQAVELAKEALDRGVPCVFKTFEYAEFGILTGYDESDEVFLVSEITGSADPVLFSNLGRPHGYPSLFVQVFDKRGELDLEAAAADSFRYAEECWNARAWPTDGYNVGAEAYRTLIAAVDSAETDPLGLRYILKILADARTGVAAYVRRLHDELVLPDLGAPAERYEKAAARLTRAAELLPAEAPWERPLDRTVTPEASKLLSEAADLEAEALGFLKRSAIKGC